MSDIMINLSSSVDTPQGTSPRDKQTRKRKRFLKKTKYLKAQGDLKVKQNNAHQWSSHKRNQTSNKHGPTTKYPPPPTATKSKGSPDFSSTTSGSDCSSKPSTSSFNPSSMTFTVTNEGSHKKPKQPVDTKTTAVGSGLSTSSSHKLSTSTENPTKYLAIDCEMVGAGAKGSISQLARCSIVSYNGHVVYDKFIKPSMPITDYRTRWSGIRPRDLFNATPYPEARKEILRLLMGKVVVGHAIHNDFKALGYTHPSALTRDTSRIPLLNQKAGFAEKECASLKRLTKAIFNREIQTGRKGHSSVEDAKATMELYKVVEEEWEMILVSKSRPT
ncbi:interferon-stimulated 20 kDa exonuclease-like 2 [Girardinichthys multiradiatus]|uniref:interferon-stimulated 20 kDa exonuclease-like 2 n=1 Tax=Girardinichthys multiradiatus TaxID=208333 RepID=UPI001FACBA47|nr:interferon-stimulated 20 kDa exonuclease-like 2 [Girardinichthys multiradiatus]XP_047217264.1 interferon-stimulated 20 kDa exonuclease-like 2 [Girardinichthys multiradiatus]XP_047217265.1 interferon-stimulated 20 kDa exonuclease-like 2 [Girardinichthys multiradiatus]